MSKMKLEKDKLLCQIYAHAKQQRKPSYKPQPLADDICKKLYVDFMGPITSASWNGCKYALTITDSYSRYCWVEDLYEKREVGLALKKFVIFIGNQTSQKVKRLSIDQGREFGIRELENWQAKKGIKSTILLHTYLK